MNNIPYMPYMKDIEKSRGDLATFMRYVKQLRSDVVEMYYTDEEKSIDFWVGEYNAYTKIINDLYNIVGYNID